MSLRGNIIAHTHLFFQATGDGAELLESKLPFPQHFTRYNENVYVIGWLIDGLFGTKEGNEYLNDMIARLTLTLPITARLNRIEAGVEQFPKITEAPIKLKMFQNAKSLTRALNHAKSRAQRPNLTDVQVGDHSIIFYAIKFQAEDFIRELGGWFDYSLLEAWALREFSNQDKDRSTLKARCWSVWYWYNKRDFKISRRKVSIMSRSENMKLINAQRKLKTKQKVIEASKTLFVKNNQGKIVIARVANVANVDVNTAKKYLKEIGLI